MNTSLKRDFKLILDLLAKKWEIKNEFEDNISVQYSECENDMSTDVFQHILQQLEKTYNIIKVTPNYIRHTPFHECHENSHKILKERRIMTTTYDIKLTSSFEAFYKKVFSGYWPKLNNKSKTDKFIKQNRKLNVSALSKYIDDNRHRWEELKENSNEKAPHGTSLEHIAKVLSKADKDGLLFK